MNLKQFDLLQYTNTVVETINQILNERNWTLKKLSDVSNISYDTLKKLMSGHTGCPTTYNLIKLSQALGVSIDYLLGLDRHLNIDYTKLPERACNLISEIANFETRPYTSIEQYRKYKSIGKSCVVLRTENDWSVFFRKSYAKKGGSEHHIADRDAYAFRQLFTIVMGYRLRMWDIPYLSNNKLSVDQVLDWINKFNPSARVFKKSDWKNARNATRAAQMLTMQEVSDLFTKMQCIML